MGEEKNWRFPTGLAAEIMLGINLDQIKSWLSAQKSQIQIKLQSNFKMFWCEARHSKSPDTHSADCEGCVKQLPPEEMLCAKCVKQTRSAAKIIFSVCIHG